MFMGVLCVFVCVLCVTTSIIMRQSLLDTRGCGGGVCETVLHFLSRVPCIYARLPPASLPNSLKRSSRDGDLAAVQPALSSCLLITMFGGSKTSSRLVWIIFLFAFNFNFHELLRHYFHHLVFQWNKNIQ